MAHTINAEMVASVHSVEVSPGDSVDAGGLLVVLESMKMEIPVLAEHAGLVEEIFVEVGTVVQEGDALVSLRLDGTRHGPRRRCGDGTGVHQCRSVGRGGPSAADARRSARDDLGDGHERGRRAHHIRGRSRSRRVIRRTDRGNRPGNDRPRCCGTGLLR